MRPNLHLIEDPDRRFIDRFVEQPQELAHEIDWPPPEELESGPWYMEGIVGYMSDPDTAKNISFQIWFGEKLGEYMSEWISRREQHVICESIASIAYKGIRLGRTIAGQIIDEEVKGSGD